MKFQNTKNNKQHHAVLAIAAAAGMALSATTLTAATNQDARNRGYQQSQERQQEGTLVFQSADKILGEPLTNRMGDELGTVDDMIVDRGTGRIEAIVIREGGFLGFGGTHVSIPFEAFFVDARAMTLSLNAGQDMLEGEDKVLPKGWHRLNDGWERDLASLAESQEVLRQKLPAADKDAEIKTMSGTITEVERVDLGEGRHWMQVRIGSESGNANNRGERTESKDKGDWVVLGPAWFSTGGETAPVRGQRVEVEAFKGYDGKMFAKTATFDGDQVRYRTDDLAPSWTDRRMRSDSERNSGPMVLLTNVLDENVIWSRSDEEVGEISDAYLELSTGHVAVLAVDINGEWWGQEVGLRGIPFDIARIGADAVTLDASKGMLGGAEVLPEDPAELRDRSNRERMFVVFEVETPVYEARR
ncbi:MAG: PRC-barrel domain-containing protein [Phycisphaerales bacterium]|jgi:sporulation protein YlmC with PRC-barrel domain